MKPRHLPNLASRLYCEPWMIRPDIHASLSGQFRAALQGERMAADDPVGPALTTEDGRQIPMHPQVEAGHGIAIVPVHGIIGKHLSTLEMFCGGYDLHCFGQQLQNIGHDPAIRTVVLDIRSPGGTVQGVAGAADAIRAMAEGGRRVVAYTDVDCCSAAYWIASAADEVWASKDAVVGSISTFCAAIDSTRAWEMEGLQLKVFRTGTVKGVGMDGKAWTSEEEAFMQSKVESVDTDFKAYITARRGLGAEHMQGQYWYAGHAPSGVVDGFAPSLQALVESELARLQPGLI